MRISTEASWATSTTLDAPLYEADLDTLAAYLVGYTGVDYPRGCDIYVTAPSPEPAPPTDTDADGIPDDVDAFILPRKVQNEGSKTTTTRPRLKHIKI